jgi:hypothetical protein
MKYLRNFEAKCSDKLVAGLERANAELPLVSFWTRFEVVFPPHLDK